MSARGAVGCRLYMGVKQIERNLRVEGRLRTLSARNHRHRAKRDAEIASLRALLQPKGNGKK